MTAIRLHEVKLTQHGTDKGAIRRRTVKADTTPNTLSETEDPWLETPHDDETSKLPLESRPFIPTSVYWVSPHSTLASKITVLDLSKDMDVQYSGMTDEYKAQVAKTMQDHSYSPAITCTRNGWFSMNFDITDDQDKQLAHWAHPWSSFGEAVLTFPTDSTHSSHPISLKNKMWNTRTEAFTINSQPFLWEPDSHWHSQNMTLYKVTGTGDAEKKFEIGKYAQKWWGSVWTGGTFVVDDREIDGVVACLTLVVVLRKKRQRAAEKNPGR
ncbi:hypothetical protein HBH98_099260 [Parastagonospora nodorum]|nr:hypothetical protein HBH52_126030 [Parastagonospora nodorum]KAH3978608.1 hypothetical protein HBH51_062970 [Parastagonospora nodorum]KAH3999248.1 hypothetical protein HBI10_119600 [Parastagonospora nodorum]KAH4025114.1 hypothetical protein HBI13_077610 [Parastagonospora nodorum]KAH4032465.1 hypothetical protein HBI09_119230 [Parastagonospora nodorum]